MGSLRLVLISDTHGKYRKLQLPDGDVLIHAGDITRRGRLQELLDFNEWLASLNFAHKLIIAGNHDFICEQAPAASLLTSGTYLQDSGVEIEGWRFWGSPWHPKFSHWAFNLERGEPLRQKWALIPDDTDVLITHTPPKGIGDRVFFGAHVGCEELSEALKRLKLSLHVFGHIHEARGVYRVNGTTLINASNCSFFHRLMPPMVWELKKSPAR